MLLFFNPSARQRSEITGAEIRFYLQDIVVGLNPDVQVAPAGGSRYKASCSWMGHGRETPFQVLNRADVRSYVFEVHYPKQPLCRAGIPCLWTARAVPPAGFLRTDDPEDRHMPALPVKIMKAGGTSWRMNQVARCDEVNAKGRSHRPGQDDRTRVPEAPCAGGFG